MDLPRWEVIDAHLLHRFAGQAAGLLPPELRTDLQILAGQAWAELLAQRHAPQAVRWERPEPGVHVVDGVRLSCPHRALDAAHEAAVAGSCDIEPYTRPGIRHPDKVLRRALRRECVRWVRQHAPRLEPILLRLSVCSGRLVYRHAAGATAVAAAGSLFGSRVAP